MPLTTGGGWPTSPERHRGLECAAVQRRLEAHPRKVVSLHAIEATGGEPDVVGRDQETGQYLFYDCAAQSPAGRRSICYDGAGQQAREKKGAAPRVTRSSWPRRWESSS